MFYHFDSSRDQKTISQPLMTRETFTRWAHNNGFVIEQVDGARVLHPVDMEDAYNDDTYSSINRCEIFVSNIPWDVAENELVPFLCQAGPINQLKLLTTLSGRARGFAYVTYANVESAHRAIRQLNGTFFRVDQSYPTKVSFSANNCTLDLTNLPPIDEIEAKLAQALAERSVKGVMSIRVNQMVDDNNNNNTRLAAKVNFLDHKYACKARRVLVPKFAFEDRQVHVDWSRPNNSKSLSVIFEQGCVPNVIESYLQHDECHIVGITQHDSNVYHVHYRNCQEVELVLHRFNQKTLTWPKISLKRNEN